MQQIYTRSAYPDSWCATVTDGVCVGCVWSQGPAYYNTMRRFGPDPYVGKTVAELEAEGFRRNLFAEHYAAYAAEEFGE